MKTANYRTRQGVNLTFTVYNEATTWYDVAGIYLFCRRMPNGNWLPVYIGQCQSFKDRLCGHERWDEAVRLGATAILAVGVSQQDARDAIEESLIAELHPELNTHFRVSQSFSFTNRPH